MSFSLASVVLIFLVVALGSVSLHVPDDLRPVLAEDERDGVEKAAHVRISLMRDSSVKLSYALLIRFITPFAFAPKGGVAPTDNGGGRHHNGFAPAVPTGMRRVLCIRSRSTRTQGRNCYGSDRKLPRKRPGVVAALTSAIELHPLT
jgi:hypothetical protein